MKRQIISEEDFFFQKIKALTPMYGVIGRRGYFDKTNNRFVELEEKFVVLDENLQVIFSHEPFGKGGNYHPNVQAKIKELNLENETEDDEEDCDPQKFRTDNSIDEIIQHLLIHYSLSHSALKYKPYNDADLEGKSFEEILYITYQVDENIEILPSSNEFIELKNIASAMNNALDLRSESRLDKDIIYYESFTEKGKNTLLQQIEWFKNNTSLTPVQDAFIRLLKARGVTADLKPSSIGCDLMPVMKEVSFVSKEQMELEQEKKMSERRAKLSDSQKKTLKEIAEKMSKGDK